MRRQVLLVLTTMVLAGTLPVSTGVASAQGPPNVMVNVKCPSQSGNGPLTVTVNPWVYTRSQGDNAEWKLIINGSSDNRIEIRAKEGWPYPSTTFSGNGSARNGSPMKASAAGSYAYDIAIYCGDEKVVIDPKMIVD